MGTFILRNFRPGERSTINGRSVAGQYATCAEVRAFSRAHDSHLGRAGELGEEIFLGESFAGGGGAVAEVGGGLPAY